MYVTPEQIAAMNKAGVEAILGLDDGCSLGCLHGHQADRQHYGQQSYQQSSHRIAPLFEVFTGHDLHCFSSLLLWFHPPLLSPLSLVAFTRPDDVPEPLNCLPLIHTFSPMGEKA